MYSVGQFVAQITPGRIGDLVRVIYLKNDGHNLTRSFATVILDRTSDMTFMLLTSYLSMYVFLNYFPKEFLWMSILMVMSIVALIVLLLNRSILRRLFYISFNYFVPDKYREEIKSHLLNLISDIKGIKPSKLLILFILTTASWMFYFFQMYVLAIALNIPISFLYTIVCISITSLVLLLPISISGIGTRDVSLIFLFSIIGISKELAISYSLLYLFLNIVPAFIGMLFWFKKPIKSINLFSDQKPKPI